MNQVNKGKTCKFSGCGKPSKTRGWCNGHYEQVRTGRPLAPLGRNLRKPPEYRLEEYTEKEGHPVGCWVWKLPPNPTGYGMLSVHGKQVLAHRYSYEVRVGPIPEGLDLDHQCRNRMCVNPDHLKPVTRGENLQNRGIDPRNKSGYRGVSWDKRQEKWTVRVQEVGGRYLFLGYFDDVHEAGEVARLKRLEIYSNSVQDRRNDGHAGTYPDRGDEARR